MESFAKIPLGQTTLKLIDRVLWVVEKSVQWSLPVQEASSGLINFFINFIKLFFFFVFKNLMC